MADTTKKILLNKNGAKIDILVDQNYNEDSGNGSEFGYAVCLIDVIPPTET